jgi:hypothetical protein
VPSPFTAESWTKETEKKKWFADFRVMRLKFLMCAGMESECFRENSPCENLEGKAFLQVYKAVINSKVREDSLVSSSHFGDCQFPFPFVEYKPPSRVCKQKSQESIPIVCISSKHGSALLLSGSLFTENSASATRGANIKSSALFVASALLQWRLLRPVL